MNGWYVVQWADAAGTGFSPHEEPGHQVPRDFWNVAGRMLRDEVVQPPEAIRSTLPHPVWGLRHVRVAGLGGYWCFTEQGRGGPFGVAGTCRFSFAAEDRWPPGAVWREGRQLATGDAPAPGGAPAAGGAPAVGGAPAAGGASRELLERVLAALVSDGGPIGVPGAPAGVAAVIEAILQVLPPGVVRSRIWHTCLLQRPTQRGGSVVAGRWPDEFRHNPTSLARQLDQILEPVPPADEWPPPADRGVAETFGWLVDRAALGEPVAAAVSSTAATLAEFLAEIRPAVTALTWRDVPAQLRSAQGRARLAAAPQVLALWAVKEHAEARRFLLAHDDDPGLCDVIFLSMLDAQWDGTADVLDLPTSDATLTDWHKRLAALLLRHLADVEELAERIRVLTRAGMPFADPDRLRQLSAWLRGLGLSPWRHPWLFPDRARWMAEQIVRDGGVGPRVFRELSHAADPAALLAATVGRITAGTTRVRVPGLSAAVAARVGRAAPAPANRSAGMAAEVIMAGFRTVPVRHVPRVCEVVAVLTRHCAGGSRAFGERWLGEVLVRLADEGLHRSTRRHVLTAAMSALPGPGLRSGRPRDPRLRAYHRDLLGEDGAKRVPLAGDGAGGGRPPGGLNPRRAATILLAGAVSVPIALFLLTGEQKSEVRRSPAPVARSPFGSPNVTPGATPAVVARPTGPAGVGAVQGRELEPFFVIYESDQEHLRAALVRVYAKLDIIDLRGQRIRQVTLTGCTASEENGRYRAEELRRALLAGRHPDLKDATIATRGQVGCPHGTIWVKIELVPE